MYTNFYTGASRLLLRLNLPRTRAPWIPALPLLHYQPAKERLSHAVHSVVIHSATSVTSASIRVAIVAVLLEAAPVELAAVAYMFERRAAA
jgi:hypothetical protein